MRSVPIPSIRSPRSGLQWGPLTLLVAVAAVLGWLGFRPGGWFMGEPVAAVRGAPVRRGPLRISVLEKGNLKAANATNLKSEIEGQTTILWLVPEGNHVEEGDLLCELDATQLIDRQLTQAISVRNAEAAYVKASQTYDIQVSQNASDIAKAEQKLTFADEDLKKFDDTKEFDIATADEAIREADEAYAQAQNKLEWSEKLADKGFLTATELEQDQISFNRAEIRQTQALREKRLLEEYNLPRQRDELVAALEEARRELERVNLQAQARLVDLEADKNTSKDKLDLEKEKNDKLLAQVAKAKIYAPVAGMVVYSQQEGGMRGNREPIAEGTSVRERQEIISIPNAAGMIAEASLHESVLKQVHVGQDCIVKVDSIPGKEFRGKVHFVALMPDQQQWWANPNLRVYRTEIAISDTVEGMRPGMSCSVEILVDEIPDTLYIPVQAVFRHQNENVSFVSTPSGYETRTVEIGRFNDKWVQVLAGVEEGEEVLLSPPPGFTLQPGDESQPGEAESGEPTAGEPGAAGAGPTMGAGDGPGAGMGVPAGTEPSSEGGPGSGRRGRGEMSPEMMERIRNGEITPEMMERFRSRQGGGGGGRGGGDRSGRGGGRPEGGEGAPRGGGGGPGGGEGTGSGPSGG